MLIVQCSFDLNTTNLEIITLFHSVFKVCTAIWKLGL